jgi:hypothetical protein
VGNPLSLTFDAADPERLGLCANRRRDQVRRDVGVDGPTLRRVDVQAAVAERPDVGGLAAQTAPPRAAFDLLANGA